MAYYDVERMCIGYYNLRDVGERRNRVVVKEIKHRKRERMMICGGLQAMFVMVEEAEISVYSPYTYECYLKS